jgi:hypothetical protein
VGSRSLLFAALLELERCHVASLAHLLAGQAANWLIAHALNHSW